MPKNSNFKIISIKGLKVIFLLLQFAIFLIPSSNFIEKIIGKLNFTSCDFISASKVFFLFGVIFFFVLLAKIILDFSFQVITHIFEDTTEKDDDKKI